MQLLRYSRNAWGQEVIAGVSFDLLWWFASAALLIILAHLLYCRLRRPRA
ncbi:MAG: hypothetical protein IT480_13120 [Gammaproteobacteria bacterium]|nr:hypothetical protein [Gammaproteobacteria bacterium]